MSTHAHSREANAAERFVRATRQVDIAFRVVRGEDVPQNRHVEHSLAVRQLEQALDELAEAQDFFDSAVGTIAPKAKRAN
ncbi:hypothetical protein [Paraburkholderia sp. BCC1885]|jgi:hypothetical protein|uniref:hypothetical protein n=1 Tax=Paraburkholderia sp. BCC1885 TaxID=2562669 RepID=UPI001183A0ED|nr:hypothetical protein [Paraburkholderia sp. BCC1885]